MSSNEPVKIECEVIYFKIRSSIYRYETFHISLHIVFKLFILPNTMISCNLLTIFLSLDKSNTEKLQAEESCAMTVCRFVLLIRPLFQAPLLLGLLQQVTGLKISRVQSFCSPDQRTFQQHMEEGAITSGSKNAKKSGKKKLSESNAEHGTRMYMCISLTFPHLTWNAL